MAITLPTPSPQSARFAAILLSIKATLHARLVEQGIVIDPSWVVLAADRPGLYKHALNDITYRIRPLRRTSPYPNNDPGAGRLGDLKVRNVAVDVYCRSSLDTPESSEVALTSESEESFGLLFLEEAALNALDLHTPTVTVDAVATALTNEPMRETYTDDPDRPEPAVGFVMGTVYFEITYTARYRTDWT